MKLLLVLISVTLLGDWTEFRGSNRDAQSTGPATPLKWSDTQNVLWKTKIPGLGWSSPVISEGILYLTTAVSENGALSLRLLAIDAKEGGVIWDREVRKVPSIPAIHSKNSHASPTPILHGENIYVHFGPLGTAKLSKKGEILWLNTELEYPHVHGSGGSPILHDGKLFLVCDGSRDPFVTALDANTGKMIWKQPRSIKGPISHSFVTPLVAMVDNKPQLFAPGPDHFAAYDVENGNELWHVRAPGWSVVPQPVVGHGMVFYNHDFDHPELMAVKLGGKGDVTDSHVVWRIQKGAPSTPTPLLIGNELYFVSDGGIASCVDAKTGNRHWMERLGGKFSSSPVFANGNIMFMDEDGHAHWVKPSTTFEVVGRNEVSGRTFAMPAFANGAMYLRTDEALLKIAESK